MKPIIMDDVDAVRADQAKAERAKLPYTIASTFSNVLREWLTPIQIAKVITRNLREHDDMVCHSHDFCDANEAMNEAFKRVLGRGMYLIDASATQEQKDDDTDLWGEAWGIAKQARFVPGDCNQAPPSPN